jgi:putative glutamine amidotransferase
MLRDALSDSAALSLRSAYVEAIIHAGGTPLLMPLTADMDAIHDLYGRLDGILLSGGGDIDLGLYEAEPSPHVRHVLPVRDRIEAQLIKWAIRDDRPLLAICRGIQMLNVAMGGTLIQDIGSEIQGALWHARFQTEWYYTPAHNISVTPGSRLDAALATPDRTLAVNSLHHQAVGRVAAGLEVVATASDGIIEGLELPHHRFMVGVQWHPETLESSLPSMRHLFASFVQAAN